LGFRALCWLDRCGNVEMTTVEGLELQLILTPPSYITVCSLFLLPAGPCPMTELWQPGGVLQCGPLASVTLAPSASRNTWVSSPLVLAVSSPFQQLLLHLISHVPLSPHTEGHDRPKHTYSTQDGTPSAFWQQRAINSQPSLSVTFFTTLPDRSESTSSCFPVKLTRRSDTSQGCNRFSGDLPTW